MFDFINEINELKNYVVGYRYVNYDDKVVFVQGAKDILFFDENKVVLKLKNAELTIIGNNLKVVELEKKYIKIVGDILNIQKVGI